MFMETLPIGIQLFHNENEDTEIKTYSNKGFYNLNICSAPQIYYFDG